MKVFLAVKTCEVFLCSVAIARVRVYCVDFLVFFCFASLVSVTSSYTEDEPKMIDDRSKHVLQTQSCCPFFTNNFVC